MDTEEAHQRAGQVDIMEFEIVATIANPRITAGGGVVIAPIADLEFFNKPANSV